MRHVVICFNAKKVWLKIVDDNTGLKCKYDLPSILLFTIDPSPPSSEGCKDCCLCVVDYSSLLYSCREPKFTATSKTYPSPSFTFFHSANTALENGEFFSIKRSK